MRIVFIGTVNFSLHCLRHVLSCDANVVGIITRKNDGANADFADLTDIATNSGIPIHYCKTVNGGDTYNWVEQLRPDIIFCFGWSEIIGKRLLSLPPMGVLGAHPTLLPKNRGRHPIIWALALGLTETGLTFFFLNERADSGPVLAQSKIIITQDETASSLYGKIELVASMLIDSFLHDLTDKTFTLIEQDSRQANYWRERTAMDGVIDWRMSAASIYNLIRALSRPYPGAVYRYGQKSVTVWKAEVVKGELSTNIEPGKVIAIMNGLPTIQCQTGALQLLEYEPVTPVNLGDYL